ncbi:hypothetical protein [uncultured Dokdonia sp.]|uniref:hypothetical protein n=1 Tax=uncultured Dokdonia sp. TaxID=575653 RepID=UPI00262A4648|nr:hypothetical protein [uncultured Dokdonia sp.]
MLFTCVLISCKQESDVITFEVGGITYKTDVIKGSDVKSEEVSYSVHTIKESAKKRYESMTTLLDFLDDYSRSYIPELDTYLILGTQTYDDEKTHMYHFFKKKSDRKAISILVTCPYDENEKYKKQIYKVVESSHF